VDAEQADRIAVDWDAFDAAGGKQIVEEHAARYQHKKGKEQKEQISQNPVIRQNSLDQYVTAGSSQPRRVRRPNAPLTDVVVTASDGTVIGWDATGVGWPLLLVHGGVGDGDGAAWRFVRPLLPDGLRAVAMDRRGRGRSDRGDDASHSLEVEADDVLAVAEALGGGVVVAAHSIGATITLQALRRAGDLIAGAVLYEPPLPGMPSGLGSSDAMLTALDEGRAEDALVAFLRDMVQLAPGDIEAYRASPAWSSRVALIWTVRRENASLRALDPDLGRYGGIRIPVELVVGDRTAGHAREAVDALAAVLPDVGVTVLEGQGHGALAQAPQLVADAIAALLARLPAVATDS